MFVDSLCTIPAFRSASTPPAATKRPEPLPRPPPPTDIGKGIWKWLDLEGSDDEDGQQAISNRSTRTFETILPQHDFDIEDYIRNLDTTPQFQGDANLIGAMPACLKAVAAVIAVAPQSCHHSRHHP